MLLHVQQHRLKLILELFQLFFQFFNLRLLGLQILPHFSDSKAEYMFALLQVSDLGQIIAYLLILHLDNILLLSQLSLLLQHPSLQIHRLLFQLPIDNFKVILLALNHLLLITLLLEQLLQMLNLVLPILGLPLLVLLHPLNLALHLIKLGLVLLLDPLQPGPIYLLHPAEGAVHALVAFLDPPHLLCEFGTEQLDCLGVLFVQLAYLLRVQQLLLD